MQGEMVKWVDASKETPKGNDLCIVLTKGNTILMAYYSNNKWLFHDCYMEPAFEDGEVEFWAYTTTIERPISRKVMVRK